MEVMRFARERCTPAPPQQALRQLSAPPPPSRVELLMARQQEANVEVCKYACVGGGAGDLALLAGQNSSLK